MDSTQRDTSGLGEVGAVPAEAKRHTYDHVYRMLRRALATGQIAEGTRLVETDLAARLGVSRTPVRDALRRLEADGFAQRGHGGGLWSSTIGPEDIENLFVVRAELDKLAARLACERAKLEQWSECESLITPMSQAIDSHGQASEAFSAAHLAFHTSIYRIAFGTRFAGFLDNHLLQYLEVASDLSYRQPARTLPAVDQHQHYLAELASGDATRAVAAAVAHVQRGETDAQDARAALSNPDVLSRS